MSKKFNNLKGIIFILLGMALASIHDNFIKILSAEMNLYLIYSFRAVIGMFLILIFLKITKQPFNLKTHFPILTILRGCLFFLVSAFFIYLYQF